MCAVESKNIPKIQYKCKDTFKNILNLSIISISNIQSLKLNYLFIIIFDSRPED